MNPPVVTPRKVRISLVLGGLLLFSAGLASTALATPVTFNLNYQTPGAGAAVGTFMVDSSLLVPNVDIGETDGLDDLLCFNLTVTVPGVPTQTFTKADLDYWYFKTDGSGDIQDVNFFMTECGSRDFFIDGIIFLTLGFYDCSDRENELAAFQAHPEQGGVCEGAMGVPALSFSGLVALLMLVGIAAVLVLRRGAAVG